MEKGHKGSGFPKQPCTLQRLHHRGGQYLSVEGDGARLALGADPLGPGRVSLAARLDLTADVLQRRKLPSGGGGDT